MMSKVSNQARRDLQHMGWSLEAINELLGGGTHKRDFIERASIAALHGLLAGRGFDATDSADSQYAIGIAQALWAELQKQEESK
jgi:hypothetical protein